MSTLRNSPLLLTLAILSTYGISLSYSTVTRLQQYESASKTAAKWSSTAAEQLRKTRLTLGAGAGAISLSLLTSLYLLLPPGTLPLPNPSSTTLTSASLNAAALLAAAVYADRFWSAKTQVPFMEGYNEAVIGSRRLVSVLRGLAAGWVAVVGSRLYVG